MTGQEIAEWRKKNKWSQTQVARAIGTDQSIVSKWERGLMQPPDDIRVQLTAALAKKQRAYEKAGGLPAAAPLPELKGRTPTTTPPNATGEMSGSRPAKRTTRSGRQPNWLPAQGWTKSGKNWKRKRK